MFFWERVLGIGVGSGTRLGPPVCDELFLIECFFLINVFQVESDWSKLNHQKGVHNLGAEKDHFISIHQTSSEYVFWRKLNRIELNLARNLSTWIWRVPCNRRRPRNFVPSRQLLERREAAIVRGRTTGAAAA